jgi:hypothetical protein
MTPLLFRLFIVTIVLFFLVSAALRTKQNISLLVSLSMRPPQQAPRIAYASVVDTHMAAALKRARASGKALRIFVATDEQAFLDYVLHRFPNPGDVVYNARACRAAADAAPADGCDDGEGGDSDGGGSGGGGGGGDSFFVDQGIQHIAHADSGLHAILDAYLLAACDHIVRTDSNLSRFATYVNPHVPVTTFNARVDVREVRDANKYKK